MPAPNKSRSIALCGILGALGAAVLTFGSLIPFVTFCLPVLASLVLLPALDACGTAMTVGLYAVVGLLALLIAPDKEAAWVFVLLGYYPILKPRFDRLRLVPRILCKLLLFNAAIAVGYWLLARVFGLPALSEELKAYTHTMIVLLLLLGNAVFILYDLALLRLRSLYQKRLQPQVRKLLADHP